MKKIYLIIIAILLVIVNIATAKTSPLDVNTLPGAADTIKGNVSVCQGTNNIIYHVAPIVGVNADSTGYIWSYSGTGATIKSSITGDTIYINFTVNATSGILTVKGHNSSGDGPVSPVFSILVKQQPVYPGPIVGSSSVCQGQTSVTFGYTHVAATIYYWSFPFGYSQTNITDSTVTLSIATGATSGTISVMAANGCGSSPVASLAITVNPLPAAAGPISGSGIVPQGQQNVPYTVPFITNATSYVWTLPNGATGTSTTNTIIVNYSSTAVSGIIAVKGHNACGDGVATSDTITVTGATPLNDAGVLSILYPYDTVVSGSTCSVKVIVKNFGTTPITSLPISFKVGTSAVINYTYTPTSQLNYLSTAIVTFPVSTNFIAPNGTSFNICVWTSLPNDADSTNDKICKNINICNAPATPGFMSGPTTVCMGQSNIYYNIPHIAYATSTVWTVPTGFTIVSQNDTMLITTCTNSAVSGNITAKGLNACGTGLPYTLAVSVDTIPVAAGVITGSTTVTAGQQNVIYTVPPIAHATSYIWTLPNGATGTSTTNTISVNFNAANSGNITVKGHSACGNGAISTLAVTVNAATLDAGISHFYLPDSLVCAGTNITVQVMVKNYGTTTLTSIPLYYQRGSLTPVLETWTGSLASGDSVLYPFNTTFATPAGNSFNMCVWTQLANDANTANDKLCHSSAIQSIPPTPGAITGLTTVYTGQSGVVYSIANINYATYYTWTLPTGATGNSNLNAIVVNYGSNAVSGNITVKGFNFYCGSGPASTLAITVNTPPACSAQFAMVPDTTTPHHYFVINNAYGTPPLHYVWSWGDGTQDTIANPAHTYATSGWYTICLAITDSSGCTSYYCDTSYLQKNPNSIISVQVIPQGTLGITTNEAHQIKIYPNPVKDILTIETNSTAKQTLEIINLVGQTIYNTNIYKNTNVDVSHFPKGIYILKLTTDKKTLVKKFVKE